MRALASELGVSRTTLYRWLGDRDKLLGDILWGLSELTLDACYAGTQGQGRERIVRTLEEFMRQCVAFEPLRRFLSAEPDCALRVLLSSGLTDRLQGWVLDLVTKEHRPTADPERVAEAIVHIGTVYCWANIVAGAEPDITRAVTAIEIALGGRS